MTMPDAAPLACALMLMAFAVGLAGCRSAGARPEHVPDVALSPEFLIPDAIPFVYKRVGDTTLSLHVFQPPDAQPGERRPAIVFFFGGGWNSGSPFQFVPQCRLLALRGMVTATAEYRVRERHGVTPAECIADAKSAIRFMREYSEFLGIDPDRIAAGGGSAGGHIAAAAAIVDGFDDEGGPISCRPNALVLFNPVVDTTAHGADRFGDDAQAASPLHNVRPGLPPTLVMHGSEDDLVPLNSVSAFQQEMLEAGNRCDLEVFDGVGHGFFNPGREPDMFGATLTDVTQFLESLGYITPAGQGGSVPRPVTGAGGIGE
jgi:acetyl esterase/lipase